MKVLVTSGATREPIDSVRFISNFSTGKTGAAIASFFESNGASVSFLHGEDSFVPEGLKDEREFSSFEDLNEKLKRRLSSSKFDAVIHAAAVSDYAPIETASGKIDSSHGTLTLTLRRNFKIVERLRSYASSGPMIVAFKLTHTDSGAKRKYAISRLLGHPGVDAVVHNDYSDIADGIRAFDIYLKAGSSAHCESRDELASTLFKIISKRMEGGVP